MTLQGRLTSLITAVGTDIKDLKTRLADAEARLDISELMLQDAQIQLSARMGELIAVQALKGNGGGALTAAASGTTLKYRKNGANLDMQIVYTPDRDVWWEVSTNIGYMEKTDAAYADCFAQLSITPLDEVAVADTEVDNSTHYQAVTQHSTVDTRVLRNPTAMWALLEGVTYTARVFPSFSAGTWRYFPGYNAMVGKVWPR